MFPQMGFPQRGTEGIDLCLDTPVFKQWINRRVLTPQGVQHAMLSVIVPILPESM